jgi:hypothetical protein
MAKIDAETEDIWAETKAMWDKPIGNATKKN